MFNVKLFLHVWLKKRRKISWVCIMFALREKEKNKKHVTSDLYTVVIYFYRVVYCKVKELVESLLVSDSNSDVCSELAWLPPSRRIPSGLCQDTWFTRSAWSSWDCSHSPSTKTEQSFGVSPPPHTVSPDCVCRNRPLDGRGGSEQRRPSGRITSAECWSSSSSPSPPVTKSAAK